MELPEDFHEKAKEKISAQMAKPVKEELRGKHLSSQRARSEGTDR